MKIVHILKGKPSPNTSNGVNTFVNGLSTALVQKGCDVEVWAITKSDYIEFTPEFKIKFFKKKRIPSISFELINEIKKQNRQETLFYFHSVFIFEFILISFLLRKHKIKYIVSPHSGYIKHSLKKNFILKFFYIQLFERRYLQNASLIHVNNINELNYILKNPSSTKLLCTPNGMFFENKKVSITPKNDFIICFMGRFSIRQKGLDLLIEGFDKYIKSGGFGKLLLIGKGNIDDLIGPLNSETRDKIIISPPLYGIQKEEQLKQSSIFIHTSRWEGFPLSLVEAASLSIPLIVSEATNLCPFVEKYNGGIPLTQNTVEEIARALHTSEKMYSDNSLQTQLAQNAYNMSLKEFSWNKITDDFFNAFHNILKQS